MPTLYYYNNTTSTWEPAIVGEIGATGPQGATGPAGSGSTGATGEIGATGLTGATGAGTDGATGATGVDGATGATGPAGTNGTDGATGSTGPQGATGAIGNTLLANLDANGFFISNAANITANYFVGTATNVDVEAVNNNYSYHVVLTTGPGDTTLHNDADDNFQYNPADGILTVNRIDTDFLEVQNSVITNLIPFDSLGLSLGNATNPWQDLYLTNSTIYLGNATISANGNSIVVDSIVSNTITIGGNVGNVGNIAVLNLNGNSSQVLAGDGNWVAQTGGGGGNLGNLQVNGTTLEIANGASETTLTIGNGPAGLTMNQDSGSDAYLRLSANTTGSQNYNESVDYSSGTYINNGGSGQITLTGAPTIETFLNNLSFPGQIVSLIINGTDTVPYDGAGYGGGTVTLYTTTPPSVDPTVVTSIQFNIVYVNQFLLDNDEGDFGIYLGRENLNLTSGLDVRIDAGDDFSVESNDGFDLRSRSTTGGIDIVTDYGNSNQIWTFSHDGTTTFPTGNITSNTSLQLTTTFANVKTVEYQTAGVWDLYVEDSITGSNTASSRLNVSFKDNLIDKPQVYIENTKESDGIALRWTFDENGNLNFPRDVAGNTDPFLRITGGANPRILSEDVSLAGPANLEITALNTIFTGFSGDAIKIYPDDGEISSTANLQIWANSGGNTEYSWTFDNTGNLTTSSNLVIGPSGLGTGTGFTQLDSPLLLGSSEANGKMSLVWYENPTGPGNIVQVGLNDSTPGSMTVLTGDFANTTYVWNFDNTGNLTLPTGGNIYYANGTIYGSGGGGANTGNVTFDNINIIGTGNLNLQPDPANSGSYLDIFLSSGPDIHIVASASANLILGKDDQSNVMTSWDGNVYIQSWDNNTNTQGGVWTFGGDGNFTITSGGTIKSGNLSIASSNGIGTISSIIEDNGLLNIFGSGNGACVAIGWQSDYSNGAGDTAQIYFNPAGNGGNIIVTTGNTSNTLYDWNFDNTGNLTLPGGGTIYGNPYTPSGAPGNTITLQPAGSGTITDQRLLIYPTAGDGDHIHMVTGNLYQTELFLGSDNFFAKLANTGNFVVQTNDNISNVATYTFGYDGNFNLPGNLTINGLTNVFGSNVALVQPNDDIPLVLLASNSNSSVSSVWIENSSDVANSNISAIYTPFAGTGAVRIVNGNNASTINIWDFGRDGNLTLPGNTFAVNYANGTQVSLGGGGTPSGNNNEIQFNSNGSFGASGNLTFTDTVGGGTVEIGNELNLLGNGTIGTTSGNLLLQPAGNIVMQASAYNLVFDITGNLTLPGNTFSINYANGTQVPLGGGGATGATGPEGATGPQGATGIQGFDGATGATGLQGDVGATGLEGPTGFTGPDGATGATGLQGDVGATGPTGATGLTGDTGATGIVGATGATGPVAGSNTQIIFNNAGNAGASANLTFNNSTNLLTVTGNATVTGTSSNLIRRAFGLVASDTGVTLDDLTVTVSSSTSQLTLSTSGSWQGTGWTETFQGGGTPSVNSWINLPLNPGFNNASGAMTGQGNGCRCVISDQTPSAKVYQITVVRSGTTGAQWNISIERLV